METIRKQSRKLPQEELKVAVDYRSPLGLLAPACYRANELLKMGQRR